MKINNKAIVMKDTQTGQTFIDVATAQKAVRRAQWKGAAYMGAFMLAVNFVVIADAVIDSARESLQDLKEGDN